MSDSWSAAVVAVMQSENSALFHLRHWRFLGVYSRLGR